MIDIHNHVLPGIDDGSRNKKESFSILKKLNDIGFNTVICTPHYICGTRYNKNNRDKKILLNQIKSDLIKDNIKVDLYLGNEVYINNEINELVLKGEISTLDNSRFILVELSFNDDLYNVGDYIYKLKRIGYIPIIAHPERYKYFQNDYKKLDELILDGVLFQCNYGSIIGKYGKEAKKLFKYMLSNDLVTFLSTDVHRSDSEIIKNFEKIKKKIIRIIGEDKFKKISNDNALEIFKVENH